MSDTYGCLQCLVKDVGILAVEQVSICKLSVAEPLVCGRMWTESDGDPDFMCECLHEMHFRAHEDD